MKVMVYGLLVALGLGAVVAPVLAGLLGVVGMAGNPEVRTWLFAVPEAIVGTVGVEKPGLAGLVVGWTVEFLPVGLVVAAIAKVRARTVRRERARAFEQAVTTFHDSEHDAQYE